MSQSPSTHSSAGFSATTSTPSQTIVVIGGAQGGPLAAARAREFDEKARIVLLEKAPHVSWIHAGLRYHLVGMVKKSEEFDQDRTLFFEKRHRIEVRTHTEAVAIDVDARRVIVQNQNGSLDAIRYDAVIFAGGAASYMPNIPQFAGAGVTHFRTLDDLKGIRASLAAGAKRAAIVGGGPFGVDAAQALHALGVEVHMVDQSTRVLPTFSLAASRAVVREMKKQGIHFHLGDSVVAAAPSEGPLGALGRKLSLRSGTTLDVDLVIVTAGMYPRTKLLADAGAALNVDGSVRVNIHMATTLPRIYACGSAVSVPHAVTHAPTWIPQEATAVRTASIAGRSAAVGGGGKESISPVAGNMALEVGGLWFARTGLAPAEARRALGDDRVLSLTAYGYDAEPWVRGQDMCVRIVVDRERGVVIGGEAWGQVGVPRRIDMLTAAVLEGWSPSRLADLDIAYSPVLGPAHDPIHQVASLASLTLDGVANPIDAESLALRLARRDDIVCINVSKTVQQQNSRWPSGTIHIPLEDLRDRMSEIPRDKTVILLSQTGQRAYLGYRILRQSSYEDVLHLDGGALAWELTLDEAL